MLQQSLKYMEKEPVSSVVQGSTQLCLAGHAQNMVFISHNYEDFYRHFFSFSAVQKPFTPFMWLEMPYFLLCTV